MKDKEMGQQRHGSLNSKNNNFTQLSGPKTPMGFTNSNTETLKFIRNESEEQQRSQEAKRKAEEMKWQKVVAEFREWHPTSEGELVRFKEAHEFLISKSRVTQIS